MPSSFLMIGFQDPETENWWVDKDNPLGTSMKLYPLDQAMNVIKKFPQLLDYDVVTLEIKVSQKAQMGLIVREEG